MGFFKYDENTKREWIEIDLKPGTPYSRATIQDYARCMDVSPEDWVLDALAWFMKECDRQGAHGSQAHTFPRGEKKRVAPWRTKVADTLYGWADSLAGLEDKGNP